MLTPAKITNHHFEASGRNAYKAESVDSFIKEVAESYEQMFRENGEMFKKINLLAQRLEEYRNDEDNIRNALLTAQRAAEKITKDAQAKAEQLVDEVKDRTANERERLDAVANEMLTKAKYDAEAIIEDAKKQAQSILDKAIMDSKEASVSARSDMIKEIAALDTMKQEVTKFKQQILADYAAQIELINQLPEVVIEKMTAEEKAAEAEQESEPAEETVTETVVEADESVEEKAATEETKDEPIASEAREAETMNVEQLQQMIAETEDTDAESDPEFDDETSDEVQDESTGFVVPDIDSASDEDLEKLVDNFDSEAETAEDITFTKPVKESGSSSKDGFKLKFENIDSYAVNDNDGNYLDDLDDDDLDDDGNDDGLVGKLKGFFRK